MAEKMKAPSVDRPELAKHDSAILDLAFAMDCTGSMGSYIKTAQQNIREIVETIVASEKSNVHLALVEYRDHPPQDATFVTRTHDFTSSVSQMKTWLDECKGCPAGLDPIDITRTLAEKGITLYTVGCEPAILSYRDFFMALAYMTGGQYTPLGGAKLLTKIIIGGAQEEMSLQQWMADVDVEVQSRIASGREIDDEALTRDLHAKLAAKGARSKQLVRNNAELAGISSKAKAMSSQMDMKAARSVFKSSMVNSEPVMDEARCSDMYEAVDTETSHYQVNRMLQKSKARNFYKK
ncbi:unnamed protein product [Mytilus coruscus]|uniref:VWFA domain-containing protein n=1 Tax=Mytilus coruscus TaxID=42192 RepID=A0A6J8EE49_MYTCO|nr:unnamed protein product [Mytilus coruscus]